MTILTLPTNKSTKLFYKKYPYKISYKRLWGIGDHYWNWMAKYNGTSIDPEEKALRQRCALWLQTTFGSKESGFVGDVKVNNGSYSHLYFLKEEDYLKAKTRYEELHIEYVEPMFDNLQEIIDGHDTNEETRKSLWFNKYRYKIVMKCDEHFEEGLCTDLYEMFKLNENVRLNKNMIELANIETSTRSIPPANTGLFRHYGLNRRLGRWRVYSMFCSDKLDAEYISFVASENISSIHKALLISELDK